jgi:quercetin dioxygenase-like cupin family protein
MTKLEVLTRQLQNIAAISTKVDGCTIHKLEQGTSMAFDILRNEYGDVFNSFLSNGTIFPLHEHPESDEIFILLNGKITVIYDTGEEVSQHKLQIGRPLLILKGTKHLLKVNEDSWIISVIMPPDKTLK